MTHRQLQSDRVQPNHGTLMAQLLTDERLFGQFTLPDDPPSTSNWTADVTDKSNFDKFVKKCLGQRNGQMQFYASHPAAPEQQREPYEPTTTGPSPYVVDGRLLDCNVCL